MTVMRATWGLRILALVLYLLTTACNPVVSASPPPSPQAVTVAYPPSLKLVDEALNSCAQANPGIALLVSETPLINLDEAKADLFLWLGEPPESAGFSAPLAMEEIVFIVHPRNPVGMLSVEEVAALLSGETGNWDQIVEMDEEVTAWSYPPENEIQQAVSDALPQVDSVSPSIYLAPNSLAMLEAVSDNPGAIGFLPKAWVTDEVKIVSLEGEEGMDLRLPVLALSANTPTGGARRLLACLQSSTGQNVLERLYEPWME